MPEKGPNAALHSSSLDRADTLYKRIFLYTVGRTRRFSETVRRDGQTTRLVVTFRRDGLANTIPPRSLNGGPDGKTRPFIETIRRDGLTARARV